MRRFIATLIAIGLAAVLPTAGGVGAGPELSVADGCPERIDPEAFTEEPTLAEWNKEMSALGARPTASPSHKAWVDWLKARAEGVEGSDGEPALDVEERTYTLDRWLGEETTLTIGGTEKVEVAGPVPYAKVGTSTGELVYLPPDVAIADADVEGAVVLRDVVPGVIPMPVFFAVAYYVHDPGLTFDYTGNYERDWASAAGRITDIEEATAAGAAGVLFAHPFPREQMAGDYHPYEGRFYDLPMAYVGVDEREQLLDAEGQEVTLSVTADRTDDVPTRTILATLPGQSAERIVIASHTDGMNAIWDNGPVGILALAEYFSSLPISCRPRTIQFAFTTAHLYLSQVGAEIFAEELDGDYDEGTVAFAVALEHLGAQEFLPAPREPEEGEDQPPPGHRLEPTGDSELFAIFVHESPVTLQAVTRAVIDRDLRRSFILRGADAPDVRFPPHHSYGGEGGPYHQALIPTVAAITGPTTLFKPAFGQDELLDPELMRRQTMAFGDVVLELDDVPKAAIAGADTAYRVGRDATEGE